MNLAQVWKNALKELKGTVPTSSFQAWLKPANLLNLEKKQAIIEVRNEFSRNLLTQNYYRAICQALESASGTQGLELTIQVNQDLITEDYIPSFSSLPDNAPLKIIPNADLSLTPHHNLNPKYGFDNFIVGGNNQFCHAAALAIAEGRSEGAYNPFFIYGEVGLGKTHIMQSIGNYVIAKNPQAKVLYITAEKFLNDLITSMRKSKMNEFRGRYRSLDYLLIDDIQFIEGKETTQEEFFHTFNALKDNGSQIVLTSDRPPSSIPRLEPRLCSRFEGGLIADVQTPSYETRLAILSRRAEDLKLKLKPEIADLIAITFPENIRRLEGALVKLQAYISFTAKPLTISFVKQALGIKKTEQKNTQTIQQSSNQKLDKVAELVADEMRVSVSQIIGRDNTLEVKSARQIFMTIARETGFSLQEIGDLCDGRSNSSILNSCRRVKDEAKKDQQLAKTLQKLENQVKKSSKAAK